MKNRTLFCVVASAIPVVVAVVFWFRSSLNAARRPAREARALSVAYELRHTTNSTMLVGASPEFRTDLATILGSVTWDLIDRSPGRDPWAVVRLILTNDQGQALHMCLRDDYPSGQLCLLSYRRTTEPNGAANGSQPIRSETNSTPSAAGSRR
jgi:hypothetical protein